mgnify:CR=1 FL=1
MQCSRVAYEEEFLEALEEVDVFPIEHQSNNSGKPDFDPNMHC